MKSGVYGYIGLSLKDSQGNVVVEREERAHSFLRNFGGGIGESLKRANNIAYVDATGASRRAFLRASFLGSQDRGYVGGSGFYLHPANAGVEYGVVVGSSNTAFALDQYDLQGTIAHGTGAGQLSYGSQITPVVEVAPDDSAISLTLAREFGNNSGGDVTVAEVGLMGYPPISAWSGWYTGSVYAKVLLTRDVLDTPITVPNGEVLAVSHILRTVL